MITCNKVKHSPLKVMKDGEIYRLTDNLSVECFCTLDKKTNIALKFEFKKGFACDGLSVPSAFRWFLKNWDLENDLYNIAGIVHDALYGNKGFCILDRNECDAIFRGMLRESGCNRLHASAADFAVGTFASSHWGNDDYHCNDMVSMSFRNVNEGH